jgi:hypothetical protein
MAGIEKKPWLARFDSYSGTSVGSILAAAAATGMPWSEIKNVFEMSAPIIFSSDLAWKLDPRKPRYPHTGLKQILSDLFGNLRMCDLKKPLFVVAMNYKTGKPKVWDCKDGDLVRDVVMASCSAPTYFPPVNGVVDGGLVANNPAMCHITGCMSKLGWGLNELWMFSLGTNGDYWKDPEVDRNTGKLEWAKLLLENTTRGNEEIATFQAQALLRERFLRIEPILNQNYALDDVGCMEEYSQIWLGKLVMCSEEVADWFRLYHKRNYQ